MPITNNDPSRVQGVRLPNIFLPSILWTTRPTIKPNMQIVRFLGIVGGVTHFVVL
jgi:hypothetical protein